MDTNQKHQFCQQSDNESNQHFAGKQIDDSQKEPDRPTDPEQPDENPEPAGPEPGIDEPEKDDPTRIDEPPEIFDEN